MDITKVNSSGAGITANSMQSLFNAILRLEELNYKALDNQVKEGKVAAQVAADNIKESDLQQAKQMYNDAINQFITAGISSGLATMSVGHFFAGPEGLKMPFTSKRAFGSQTVKAFNDKIDIVEKNATLDCFKNLPSEKTNIENREITPETEELTKTTELRLKELQRSNFEEVLSQEDQDYIRSAYEEVKEKIFNRLENVKHELLAQKDRAVGEVTTFYNSFQIIQQSITGLSGAITSLSNKAAQEAKARADYLKQLADFAIQVFNLNNNISTSFISNLNAALDSQINVQNAIDQANRAA